MLPKHICLVKYYFITKFSVNASLLYNDNKSKREYQNLLILIFSILLIVYLYFAYSSYEDIKDLKSYDTDKKKYLTYASFWNAPLKVDINKKEGLQKYDKIHFRKEVYFYYGNKRTKV